MLIAAGGKFLSIGPNGIFLVSPCRKFKYRPTETPLQNLLRLPVAMIIAAILESLAALAPPLRKAEKRLGCEVNVTNYSVDEFRKKVAEGDHFLLKGNLQFVKSAQRDMDAITRK